MPQGHERPHAPATVGDQREESRPGPHHPLSPLGQAGSQLGPSPGAGRKLGGWGWARGLLLLETGESSRRGGGPQHEALGNSPRVGSAPACPGPRSPSRASAQVREDALGDADGPGQEALWRVPYQGCPQVSPSVLFSHPAPSLWGLKTLPYTVIRPTGTLSCIHPQSLLSPSLGADWTTPSLGTEDLCIVGPDAPASHSQLLRGG